MSAERGPSSRNSANPAVQYFSDPQNVAALLKHSHLPEQKTALMGRLRETSSQIRNAYPIPKYYKAVTTLAKAVDAFEADATQSMANRYYRKYTKIQPMSTIVQETIQKLKRELKAFMHECVLHEEPIAEVTTAFGHLTAMLDFQLVLAKKAKRESIMGNQATALRDLYNECVQYAEEGPEGPQRLTANRIRFDMSYVSLQSKWDKETMAQFVSTWEFLKIKFPNMPPMKHADVDVIVDKIKLLAFGFKIDDSIRNADLINFMEFKTKVGFDTLSAENESIIRHMLMMKPLPRRKPDSSGGARRKARGARSGTAKAKRQAY